MSTVNLTIRSRPVRIGFLIRENNLDDVSTAVEINTLLWGGIFNPLIPVGTDHGAAEGLLEYFAVDILHDVAKTTESKALLKQYPFLRAPNFAIDDAFLKEKKQPGFLDVGHLLNDASVLSKIKESALFNIDSDFPHAVLAKVLTGYYMPSSQTDIPFSKLFRSRLNPTVSLLKKNHTAGVFHHAVTPIELTGQKISSFGSFRKHYQLMQTPVGVYLGIADCFQDLVYYWNLRASGYQIHFACLTDGAWLETNVISFMTSVPNRGSEGSSTEDYSLWYRMVNEAQVPSFRNRWKRRSQSSPLPDDCRSLAYFTPPLQFQHSDNHEVLGHKHPAANGKFRVSFALSQPPFARDPERDTSLQTYVATVQVKEEPFYRQTLNLPYVPSLNEEFSRKIIGPFQPFELRCEPNGFGILVNNNTRSLTCHPAAFEELIFILLHKAQLDPTASQAGNLTQKVINAMGHIDSCRVFKIRGVRKLLRSLKVDTPITRQSMQEKIHNAGQFGEHKSLHIALRHVPDLSEQQVITFLLEHDMFRAGLQLQCASCRLDNWLPVKRLDDFWSCEYCGHNNRLSISLNSRGDWKFRKSGLFAKDNNQEGAIPVILTLMTLYRVIQQADDRQVMLYTSAVNFTQPKACEVDCCVVNVRFPDAFEIAIAECKDEGGEIDDTDLSNLVTIYNALEKAAYVPFIVVSKTSQQFLPDEIRRFMKIAEQGYRMILLTNTEMEPYEPYMESIDKDKLPCPYPQNLQDMHRNSVARYLTPPTVIADNHASSA